MYFICLTFAPNQIFSLLEPVDLLYLFRTNKAFHNVLSANNAVWKAARANRGGVPDCISGMSEAEWANLLFGHDDSHCQVCLVSVCIFCTLMTTSSGMWQEGNMADGLRYQAQSVSLVHQ
jgi:hypothetical protein